MDKDNILDYTEPSFNNPEHHLASTGARLANYLLDTVGFYIMIYVIALFV